MFESLFSQRGLSLERIRVLIEVHDAGSISGATPGNIARQSLHSRQLRELSEYFGCEMTERQGKVLKLTPNGIKLVEIARPFLYELSDLRAECLGERAVFTIAAGDSLIQWLLIPRMGTLIRGLADVRFSALSLKTKEIILQLSEGRIDFGLVRKNAVGSGLKSVNVGVLEYRAVVPLSLAPLKQRPSFQDVFKRFPHAMQTTDGQFTRSLHKIAVCQNPTFRPALGCESFPQIMAAVRSGSFSAVIPELAIQELQTQAVHTIPDPSLKTLNREVVLVWNPRIIKIRTQAGKVFNALDKALKF